MCRSWWRAAKSVEVGKFITCSVVINLKWILPYNVGRESSRISRSKLESSGCLHQGYVNVRDV